MKQVKKIDHDYQEKGSSQLLISDLRLLRSNLLSTNNIIGLQTWVIILIAVMLFLRYDEYHGIQMEDFLVDIFEITERSIDALVLKVFGKSDKTWVNLKLWADHKYPDLCPVRHLLVYLYLTGIKSGCLFPCAKELLGPPPADGCYKEPIKYGKFLKSMQKLCKEVLPEREDLKIGAHSLPQVGVPQSDLW